MIRVVLSGVLLVAAIAVTVDPAFAQSQPYKRATSCKDCVAPRPHYDSREVVPTTRTVDHSRTINTRSVVIVPSRKVRTTNHLVVRKNTVRHVGVVRHNHTIIEKEIVYKRRVPAPTMTINFVQQRYRTVHRPATVSVQVYPVRPYPSRSLRVRG